MSTTSIEWTEKTWNPVRGCSVISPGCANCYAMKQAHRFSGSKMTPNGHGGKTLLPAPYHGLTKQTKAGPQWTGVVRTIPGALNQPRRWKEPRKVFVNSMSDLFHESVPDKFIDRVFGVMGDCQRHTFQILTKRPARMKQYFAQLAAEGRARGLGEIRPYQNVWLGVSVENQHFADERIPLLLQTPAAVRFVSAEPLLSDTDFSAYLPIETIGGVELETWLDWIIVGGESGPQARPFNIQWALNIVRQCRSASVPVFVKQLGAFPYDGAQQSCEASACVVHNYARLKLKNRKGGDITEFPSDLRVREFPCRA